MFRIYFFSAVCLVTTITLIGAGCNRQESAAYSPVSGVVTLDGHPIEGAKVMFVPVRYRDEQRQPVPYAYGITDKDGRYHLVSENNRKGAAVGRHTVFISTAEAVIPTPDDATNVREEPSSSKAEDQTEAKSAEKSKPNKPLESSDSTQAPQDPDQDPASDAKPKQESESKTGTDEQGSDAAEGDDKADDSSPRRIMVKSETLLSQYNTNSILEFVVKAGTSNQANFRLSRFPD